MLKFTGKGRVQKLRITDEKLYRLSADTLLTRIDSNVRKIDRGRMGPDFIVDPIDDTTVDSTLLSMDSDLITVDRE